MEAVATIMTTTMMPRERVTRIRKLKTKMVIKKRRRMERVKKVKRKTTAAKVTTKMRKAPALSTLNRLHH